MFQVRKKYLLLTAGIVWFAAGFNIVRIGLLAFHGVRHVLSILLAAVVFLLFQIFVFGKLVKKHTARIHAFEEDKHSIFRFFDKKSYIIMACMISFGVLLRVSGLAPDGFIAFFYTGLGTSPPVSGGRFCHPFPLLSRRSWRHFKKQSAAMVKRRLMG